MYKYMEKTTLLIREDVKEAVEKEFGKRQLSKIVNELLFKEIVAKKTKSLFGADKWLTEKKIKEIREHQDRF